MNRMKGTSRARRPVHSMRDGEAGLVSQQADDADFDAKLRDVIELLKSRPFWQIAESLYDQNRTLHAKADEFLGRNRPLEERIIEDFNTKAESHLMVVEDAATRDAYAFLLQHWQRSVRWHSNGTELDQKLAERVQYYNSKARDLAYQKEAPLATRLPERRIFDRLDHSLQKIFAKDAQAATTTANKEAERTAGDHHTRGAPSEAQTAPKPESEMVHTAEAMFSIPGPIQSTARSPIESETSKLAIDRTSGNREDTGPASWDLILISFLSDFTVQITTPSRTYSQNYGELGFADRRTKCGADKPNSAWLALKALAEQRGIIRDSSTTGGAWSKVEKRMQEIRKVLRKHFGITGDPIAFIPGPGYQAKFKIGCAPSFNT